MYGVEASLSQGLIDHLRDDVDQHLEKNPAHKFLDHIKLTCEDALNEELTKKGYPPFEYAIIFRYIEGVEQEIHVDGVDANNLRRSSLNIITHGEKATFEWFIIPEQMVREEKTDIKSFKFDHVPDDRKKLLEAWPVPKVHCVKTNVPHRFIAHEPLNLVCLRFKNNPDFFAMKKLWK